MRFCLLLTLLSLVLCQISLTGTNIFIVTEGKDKIETIEKEYSQLWKSLKKKGYQLKFSGLEEASLISYNENLYHHVIFFAPELKKWGSNLNQEQLMKFVEKGGNLIMTYSPNSPKLLRSFASQFSIQTAPFSEKIYDLLHTTDKEEIKVQLKNSHSLPSFKKVISTKEDEILYEGTSFSLNQNKNPLIFPILRGNPTTYSWNGKEKSTFGNLGPDVTLVAGLQTRDGARISFVGSQSLFSDKSFSKNEHFVQELLGWTFQEKSVLRIQSVRHHKVNETKQMDWYRIKDELYYEVEIVELKQGKWVPFELPANDKLQLEFIMLDPYVRTNLQHTKKKGVYSVVTKLPDHYGVFTIQLTYKRHGFNLLEDKQLVSLRPFRHDEYPRFLTAAYPYYASAASMISGFLLVTVFWLYYDDKPPKKTQ